MSLNNVKLTSTGRFCRVNIITEPGSGEGTFFVEKFWIDFSWNGISGTAVAKVPTGFDCLRVGIATLDHKLFNDALEKRAVKIMLFGEVGEILFLDRRFIIENGCHVT